MSRRRVLIIVNPTAGRSRRAQRRLERVVAVLERRGCTVVLRHTRMPGDAEVLARVAEPDFEVIVAAGGDGTINEVVNGVCAGAAEEARPVALLPFGSANVLAHDIGLPRDPERLAALIAEGPARPAWPGRIGTRLFAAIAGVGFDAEIVAAVAGPAKRRFGRLAFVWAIVTSIRCHRPVELAIRVDGAEHRAAAMIATTGRCYAGPYVVAPEADLGEPVLDLLLFQRAGRFAALRYLAALLLGRLARHRDVVRLRCRGAAVIAAAAPVPAEADGEPVGTTPIALGVAERPLLLVRP